MVDPYWILNSDLFRVREACRPLLFRILFLNRDVSSAGVHGRLSWSAAIVTHLVTQDFLLLVQKSEEIRHKRVMTASQASA